MFSSRYLTEVLGVTNYVCPSAIQDLRRLEGGLPCRFLVVVFKNLSLSQKDLLKKIMSSIGIFKYSTLEVKEEKVLDELFEKADLFAQFICIFGGTDFVQSGKLLLSEGQLFSTFNNSKSASFFQTAYSLEDLEGKSLSIKEKKQKLWSQLKLWKKESKL